MASAFWALEDGRGFARRWTAMAYMLELITDELKLMPGAEAFYVYLEKFVMREENGDTCNGYGGFIRGDADIMFNFDLRAFAPQNRNYFWQAAQLALLKLKMRNDAEFEGIVVLFTTLLDMHKRIKKREDPMQLNHLSIIIPEPDEQLGPGW
jgi:hypothetical protein